MKEFQDEVESTGGSFRKKRKLMIASTSNNKGNWESNGSGGGGGGGPRKISLDSMTFGRKVVRSEPIDRVIEYE